MPTTPHFEIDSPYRRLAHSLDALPNRFPPAPDESDLRLLAKLFSPEEAGLAAYLLPEPEPPAQIAARLDRDLPATIALLKEMAKNGLISMGKTTHGRLGFALMPFVVGIYEAQGDRIDAEFAELFENYYSAVFKQTMCIQPQFHRVIPVGESVKNNMEVRPFESVTELIGRMQSWGVINCICRVQKKLIGQACEHPLDVCMVLSSRPEAFTGSTTVHALSQSESLQTLKRAAEAGLVHCVSNNQQDLWYICNCCTCSCGILRGMAELGISNVVARSAFVNRVDEAECIACGECLEACQFSALSLADTVVINEQRCVGCGVCVPVCPQTALGLERRAGEAAPPVSEADWRTARGQAA